MGAVICRRPADPLRRGIGKILSRPAVGVYIDQSRQKPPAADVLYGFPGPGRNMISDLLDQTVLYPDIQILKASIIKYISTMKYQAFTSCASSPGADFKICPALSVSSRGFSTISTSVAFPSVHSMVLTS